MTWCCLLLMCLKSSSVCAGGQKAETGEAEARLLTFCRRFVANAAEDAWASHQAAVRTGASDIHTWDQVSFNVTTCSTCHPGIKLVLHREVERPCAAFESAGQT